LQRKKKSATLHAAAADGFVLTVDEMETESTKALDAIMPARAVDTIKAAKLPNECYLTVSPNKAQAVIAYDGGAVLTRLIEGTFPDWRQIIPSQTNASVTVVSAHLAAAVKAAASVAKDNNDVSRYRFHELTDDTAEGMPADAVRTRGFTVSATSADAGNVETPVPVIEYRAYPGPLQEIALNVKYLDAVLTAAKADRVTIDMNTPNQAVVVRSVGRQDLTVIMPMVIGAT
jgi:DNA polymerase-3 subunit beta